MTRWQRRLPASASRTCLSHNRWPIDGSMSSLRLREAATSRGFRIGMTTNGVASQDSMTLIHKSINRQKRGSLTTNRRLGPNSAARTSRASSKYWGWSGDAYQLELMGSQSSQLEPAEARISLFNSNMRCDSQWPRSLPRLSPPIGVLGMSHPTRFSVRLRAEVPLRCMPAMMIALAGFSFSMEGALKP